MIHLTTVLQKCISLSSTEAEDLALPEARKTIAWLRRLLLDLKIPQGPIAIYQDNSGAIRWSNESASKHFNHMKHNDLRYCYVNDMRNKKDIEINPLTTERVKADMPTKPLIGSQFAYDIGRPGFF